jgi:hypothetical protein
MHEHDPANADPSIPVPPTPTIYHHNFFEPGQSPVHRLVAGLLAFGCLTVLILAASVTPDPTGLGTHKQLGMAPCGMLLTTGMPCMTCGMTTSYSHFVRGNLLASLYTQPGGTVLAFLTACMVWVLGYVAITGLPGSAVLNRLPLGKIAFALFAFLLVAWTYKVILNARGVGGW